MNNPSLDLGRKVIGYAINLLAWGTALAVAWSCSTLMLGIIMFIVMSLLMGLLAAVLHIFIALRVPDTSIEAIGAFVGNTSARVTGLFKRSA